MVSSGLRLSSMSLNIVRYLLFLLEGKIFKLILNFRFPQLRKQFLFFECTSQRFQYHSKNQTMECSLVLFFGVVDQRFGSQDLHELIFCFGGHFMREQKAKYLLHCLKARRHTRNLCFFCCFWDKRTLFYTTAGRWGQPAVVLNSDLLAKMQQEMRKS